MIDDKLIESIQATLVAKYPETKFLVSKISDNFGDFVEIYYSMSNHFKRTDVRDSVRQEHGYNYDMKVRSSSN